MGTSQTTVNKNHHILFIGVHLFLLFTLLGVSYVYWDVDSYIQRWPWIISRIDLVLLSVQIFSCLYKRLHYTDFRLWYILLTHLFMFGQVFLLGFGLDEFIVWNIYNRYEPQLFFHTCLYLLCSAQAIFIGLFWKDLTRNAVILDNPNNDMFNAGLWMFIIALPCRLIEDIGIMRQAQEKKDFLGSVASVGFYDDIAYAMVPALIYIIASGKLKKKSAFFLVGITIVYFVMYMILSGDRRFAITGIIALVFCFLYTNRVKLKVWVVVTLGYIAFVLLNLLTQIREIRRSHLVSIKTFFELYMIPILTNINFVFETMGEFGASIFSVSNIVKNIPAIIPYQYGMTYIYAVPSIFPIGWLIDDFFSKATMSWLINIMEKNHAGESLLGDLYSNFGWVSILVAIGVGFLLSKMINGEPVNRLDIAKQFSLFYILINLVRSSVMAILRPTLIAYFLPLLVLWIVSHRDKRTILARKIKGDLD